MTKKYDVVALGELLIDFTEIGLSSEGKRIFEQNPGGAPANVLCAASRQGCNTAFIGKVGNDSHGRFLKSVLDGEKIGTEGLILADDVYTTLAFVSIDANGEREFSFARLPGADTMLGRDELNTSLLHNCRIFHFGSLSLTNEPSREATFSAIKIASEAGALISYDPNYRSPLWKSEQDAVEMMRKPIPMADVIKVSEMEATLITGEKKAEYALDSLLNMGVQLAVITMGADGAMYGFSGERDFVPSVKAECVVDTTGAGDTFWGAFLSKLSAASSLADSVKDIKHNLSYAHAAASLCVSRRGAIPSIPYSQEVEKIISKM